MLVDNTLLRELKMSGGRWSFSGFFVVFAVIISDNDTGMPYNCLPNPTYPLIAITGDFRTNIVDLGN